MRGLIIIINGLVAGAGARAYLEAQTWAGAMFIVGLAGAIILYGESIRRSKETPMRCNRSHSFSPARATGTTESAFMSPNGYTRRHR